MWRKQLNNHAVDLRIRKRRTSRVYAHKDPQEQKRITREQILREIEAQDVFDAQLSAAWDVPADDSLPKRSTPKERPVIRTKPQQTHLVSFRPRKKSRSFARVFISAVLLVFMGGGIWGYGLWQRASDLDTAIRTTAPRAYQDLVRGKDAAAAFSFIEAEEAFSRAAESFERFAKQGDMFGGRTAAALSYIPFSLPGVSQVRVVHTAASLARAGEELSKAMRALLPIPNSRDVLAASSYMQGARAALASARDGMRYITQEDVPIDFRSDFFSAYTALAHTDQSLGFVLTYGDTMLTLLGHEVPRTYLAVFQDPRELRASGGVVRRVATFTVSRGEITDFRMQDIASIDQQLTANVVPPYPIGLLSTAWSMHDANWFADFPMTGEKLAWFFEKSGGPTVDGVIVITLPDREADELIAQFTEQMPSMSYDEQVQFADTLSYYLAHKDIMLYAASEDTQKFIDEQSWGGRIALPDEGEGVLHDVSSVVYSNLTGSPTSHAVDTAEENILRVTEGGMLERTVRITRTYREEGEADFTRDYVRIYAPSGSRLAGTAGFSPPPSISPFDYAGNGFDTDYDIAATGLGHERDDATGVDIFEESGFTVFGVWMDLERGERRSAELSYILPDRLTGTQTYVLSVVTQPGIAPIHTVRIEGTDIVWCGEGVSYEEGSAALQYISTADREVVCTLKKD